MNEHLKSLLVFLVIFVNFTLAFKKIPECELKATIEQCLKSGFLVEKAKSQSLPINMDELNQICDELKISEKCAKDFMNKCAETAKEKRVLDHSFEGTVRVLKRLCRTTARKTEFLKHVNCGNSVLKEGLQCLNNYKLQLFAANQLNDKKQIMRILCCKIRDVGPCVGEVMKQRGEAVCSNADIDYYRQVKLKVREELTSVICADFERDTCQNVQLPELKNEAQSASQSFIVPMKQLLDKVLA